MKKSGFTLIELLVVISLIGLMFSFFLSHLSFNKARSKAKAIEIAQWLTAVAAAEQDYKTDKGSYYQDGNGDVAVDLKNMGYLDVDVVHYGVRFEDTSNVGSATCKVLTLLTGVTSANPESESVKNLGGPSFCTHFCRILGARGVIGNQRCDSISCESINDGDKVGVILECQQQGNVVLP